MKWRWGKKQIRFLMCSCPFCSFWGILAANEFDCFGCVSWNTFCMLVSAGVVAADGNNDLEEICLFSDRRYERVIMHSSVCWFSKQWISKRAIRAFTAEQLKGKRLFQPHAPLVPLRPWHPWDRSSYQVSCNQLSSCDNGVCNKTDTCLSWM